MTGKCGIDFSIKQSRSPLNILQTIGHGVGMIDVEGDGLLDIVLAGSDKVHLFRNLGGFKFQNITEGSGLVQKGYWGGVAVGDVDNDGRSDLYVNGYDCAALYRNAGDGRFVDITAASGLAVKPKKGDYKEWRTSAGFADVDADGRLDLFVGRYAEFGPGAPDLCSAPSRPEKYSCGPDAYIPQRGSLFRNLGGFKFQDVSATATMIGGKKQAEGRCLGVAFADYNDDGRVDIALANDERPGDLFENQGGLRFKNRGVESGTAYSPFGHVHGGMGIDWGDYDGDSRMDLFVTTYENEAKSLYNNVGGGMFQDRSLDAGLAEKMDRWVGFGAKMFDYDRDGKLDLVVTSGHVIDNTERVFPGTQYRQPLQLFRNESGSFRETTSEMLSGGPRLLVGRGLAVGDLDNDGRQDIVVTDHDGATVVLRGASKDTNRWVSLRLVGKKSNRDGFGATVTIRADGIAQRRDSTNAGSYMAANDHRLFFGLGTADKVESVEIRWPSGRKQTLRNLETNREHTVTEL